MNDQSALFLAKAERAVRACHTLRDAGHPDFAVSRAYYVMLYATDALLAARGLHVPEHEGAHAAFAEHYTGAGLIDPAYHQRLVEIFNLRLTADYDPGATFSREDAARIIDKAEDFLAQARHCLDHVESEGPA